MEHGKSETYLKNNLIVCCFVFVSGGGAAGAACCVVCHPGDTDAVGAALLDDDLFLHHEYFHGCIRFEQEANSFQQVLQVWYCHVRALHFFLKRKLVPCLLCRQD